MSFEQPVTDQVAPLNVPADQPLTFNVGERTFNAESAITKIEHAEAHIAKIEAENAAYKLQVDQSTKLDDALAQLRAPTAEPQNVQPAEPTSSVSAEQIGEIANKQIAEFLAAKQVEDNASAAVALREQTYTDTGNILNTTYGEKTNEAIAQKAIQLGMSKEALYNMAYSPDSAKLLLEIMKVTAAPSQSSPTSGYNIGSHSEPSQQYIDYGNGKVTSSTILAAINKAGAGY